MVRQRTAFIGLGSNLGDRRNHLERALHRLGGEGLQLRRVSSLYESAAQGPVLDQPPFYNAVVEVATALPPMDLLHRCLELELELGRRRLLPKGPRTIDLDLLLMEDEVLGDAQLTVPHPELVHRAFALIPLLELCPMTIDPRDGTLLCRHAGPLLRAQLMVRLGSLPAYPARTRLPNHHFTRAA